MLAIVGFGINTVPLNKHITIRRSVRYYSIVMTTKGFNRAMKSGAVAEATVGQGRSGRDRLYSLNNFA